MPIFEYKCRDCGKISEVLVKGSGKAKPKCEHCGSGATEKQLSVFSAAVTEGQSKKCLGCTDNACPHAGG